MAFFLVLVLVVETDTALGFLVVDTDTALGFVLAVPSHDKKEANSAIVLG